MRPLVSIAIAAVVLLAINSVFVVREGQTGILLQF